MTVCCRPRPAAGCTRTRPGTNGLSAVAGVLVAGVAIDRIPQILPTGVTTYEHVVSMPFDDIPGVDDLERAERLVQKCVEVRGVKIHTVDIPIPVRHGPAFEGERVRKEEATRDLPIIVISARDVTERKTFEDQLARQAFYDPLTGLTPPKAPPEWLV